MKEVFFKDFTTFSFYDKRQNILLDRVPLLLKNRLSYNALYKKMSWDDCRKLSEWNRYYHTYMQLYYSLSEDNFITINSMVKYEVSMNDGGVNYVEKSIGDIEIMIQNAINEVNSIVVDFNEVEQDLQIGSNFIIIQSIQPIIQELNIIFNALDYLIVYDEKIFRIVSLSVISNQQILSDYYLQYHLDFIFNYSSLNEMGLFQGYEIYNAKNEEELHYNLQKNSPDKAKPIYNFIKFEDKKILYVYFVGGNKSIFNMTKKENSIYRYDFSEMGWDVINNTNNLSQLHGSINDFYVHSMRNNLNDTFSKNVLLNLERLSNLQRKYYNNFLTDFELELKLGNIT
jgi:hypothetical protein